MTFLILLTNIPHTPHKYSSYSSQIFLILLTIIPHTPHSSLIFLISLMFLVHPMVIRHIIFVTNVHLFFIVGQYKRVPDSCNLGGDPARSDGRCSLGDHTLSHRRPDPPFHAVTRRRPDPSLRGVTRRLPGQRVHGISIL